MKRVSLPLLVLSGFSLSGCVASMAASAVGAAVNAARPAETTEDLRHSATAACTAQAIQHGEVHIIDAAQRSGGRVTVWGTATQGTSRQAFECSWRGQVRDFDLRALPPRQPPEAAPAQPS